MTSIVKARSVYPALPERHFYCHATHSVVLPEAFGNASIGSDGFVVCAALSESIENLDIESQEKLHNNFAEVDPWFRDWSPRYARLQPREIRTPSLQAFISGSGVSQETRDVVFRPPEVLDSGVVQTAHACSRHPLSAQKSGYPVFRVEGLR